jgi:ankyrin repeat protein
MDHPNKKKATCRIRGTLLIALLCFVSCFPSRPRSHEVLESAIRSGDTKTLQGFVDQSNNLNLIIRHKNHPKAWGTLLHIAVEADSKPSLRFLLVNGADPNKTNWNGSSVLSHAIICSKSFGNPAAHDETLRLLLDFGSDVNQTNQLGVTPLALAALTGDTTAIRRLIAAGAQVNSRTKGGATPLHVAANTKVADLLLQAGADPYLKTVIGQTPLDQALEQGRNDVANVISNFSVQKK